MTIGPAPDWTEITWLVGNYEGTPTLIAVDEDGNIVVPMMAIHDGVLQTVACDAQGRVIMIPTDPADIWGNAISMGNAELAAVLGPAKRFDRRGQVLWMIDFEHGLQGLNSSSDHADSTRKLSYERANYGGLSLKLDPRGSDNSYVRVWRLLTPIIQTNVGIECWVSYEPDLSYIYWNLYRYDGTNYWLARLRYEHSSGDWCVYMPGPDYEPILEGKKMQTGSGAWTAVKMVADFTNNTYLRALIGNEYIDISEHALFTDSSGSLAQIETRVQVDGMAAGHGPAYFDSWIVTINEPPNPEEE